MAQSYASRLPRFHLMIGAAASGKSTAARILSRCLQGPGQPQLRYVSSSDIRRQLYGDSGVLGRWEEVEAVISQHSLAHDIWLSLPSGTSHNQSSPWSSALGLAHWRECNELHFISGLPPLSIQLITGTAGFIRHFPAMSAMGARQHPEQGPLLSSPGRWGRRG
jgi:hypothetical protein